MTSSRNSCSRKNFAIPQFTLRPTIVAPLFDRLLALGVAGRYNGRMRNRQESSPMHGTTVLCVRKDGKVVLIADGQVTMGDHVMKHTARKTRRLYNEKVVAGIGGVNGGEPSFFLGIVRKMVRHYRTTPNASGELVEGLVAGVE